MADAARAPEARPVVARDLWKVFGRDPRSGMDLARSGAGRSKVLEETGCVVAVRDVSFEVERGEIFVVMGLSGSGKSTLIRCLSRLNEPTAGRVLIDGEDISDMTDERLRDVRRHTISMVFQHFGLFPHRRVIDNVAFGLEVQGLKRDARYERAGEVLEVVGLSGWGDYYPQQLSGGMQQRVGLARALAVDPEILFFDEPFSALDPLIRSDMQNELLALQRRMQRTLVFITHDFLEALKLGDRIAIMKDGIIVQVGTPEEVVAHPADDYVAEFTKDAPKVKVLSARTVMVPLDGVTPADALTVDADAKLESFLPRLVGEPRPMVVVDERGLPIGLVDPAAIAEVLGGEAG